jgi:hypothetical protein
MPLPPTEAPPIVCAFLPWPTPLEILRVLACRRTLLLIGIETHCGPLSPPWGYYGVVAPSATNWAVLRYRRSRCNSLAPLPSGENTREALRHDSTKIVQSFHGRMKKAANR